MKDVLIITIDKFIAKIKNPSDVPLVKKAYDVASELLKDKKRKNGESEITHCLEVANILLSLNVDVTTIISAILHECADTSDFDSDIIESNFGKDVDIIINSVAKINRLEMIDESENSAIYLRKVMVGLCEDVRVLFIKLADRLHNMRTMECFSKEHQKKVANETLSVLVPIAHRLGINAIKSELENLCLFYLKPEVYNDILEKLNDTVEELNEYLQDMKDSISHLLIDNDIKFEIKGRVKSVYSIYNKLSNGKKWENIYDILALRVFVEKESDCYAVIGLIHSKYRPMQNRFKDYIAVPKENMYQSLHTTIFGEGGRLYEVQIRTYEMDEIAEKGIASHWSYKEKGAKKIQTMMEQKLELYRSIIENTENSADTEFTSVIDSDILSDLIYVFTPKGDVVELPKGSTPIDFAYRIHSKVGDTMVGAIVNDQMVPINSVLKENDIVKVMTNPNAKPNKDWLNIVKTSQAKNKIKAYFSKIDKEQYILKGKTILEKELRKRKLSITDILSSENIDKICTGLKLKDLDDIYVSIGSFRYTANFVINYVIGNEDSEDTLVTKKSGNININHKSDILVDNKVSILTHLARCCNPVKNDEIVGFITKNDGIAIHRKNCANVSIYNNRMVEVSWSGNRDNLYFTSIIVKISSDKNKLSDLIAVITTENLSIVTIDMQKENVYRIDLKVKDTSDIENVIKNINKLRYVKEVYRK
ncbi:MAG: bifunctional (p)ppGpp synthetase/guanosine-3',5'-bis(diphosphate) 3'-pyrophosphohydrolase [Firmicutes bacterium]|nr:bifunctional (p)ppGpp synthetase/guanosine-3',5'-bis(diphosphate) 3'-pyrophosphohydrolase [Bacillota bacterium]